MATRILITDLTAMQGDRVCIAGIDQNLQNIRPVLPQPGVLYRHLFHKGNAIIRPRAVLRLQLKPSRNTEVPHSEDHDWHDRESLHSREYLLDGSHWQQILQRLVETSPPPLFGAGLMSHRDARHRKLKRGSATNSLGTVAVEQEISFRCEPDKFERGKYRYRLYFQDHCNNLYDDIPITDLALQTWATAQLHRGATPQSLSDWLTRRLNDAQKVYLRLGLSREFRDEFWLQVNGIYSFPDWLQGRCFADFEGQSG